MFGLSRRRKEQRSLNVWPTWTAGSPLPGAMQPGTALQIADVFACIRVLADSAASVPLIAYRRTDSGRERIGSGKLAGLLERPAPATTQANLIAQAVAHLTAWGNCFVGKFRDREGRLDQLAMLHPDRVQVELVAGEPRYTVFGPKGEKSVHGTDDIVHVRALSTDGLVGLSPIRECRIALGLAAGLGDHALAFFQHGGRPSGIIKVPAGTGRDRMQDFADLAEQRHGGAKNAHRIAIISGDAEWQQISGPLEDLQFVEQRRLSTEEICRIFRVMPWMVGASSGDSLTYSNTEQQALAFVTYSLRPWLVAIEQAISADRDLCPGPAYVEFLLDALLRADSKTRAEIYQMALDPVTGWMNRPEVRRLENLEDEREDELSPQSMEEMIQ